MDSVKSSGDCIHQIKFYIVIALQIPALILSLSFFVFFILNHIQLRKLHNQALLVLLIVNFIQLTFNIPLLMHFLHLSYISPSTAAYCKWWIYLEFTLDTESILLAAIISIQRHTLIFHSHTLRIRSKRYICYYFPIALCIAYPMIFYLITVVFYPCDDSQWNFTLNMCGDTTCYLSNNPTLATFDWIVNTGAPIGVIVLANGALIGRVVRQKYRRHQSVSWAKQRRMTVQLLSISCLYLMTWTPTVVVSIMQELSPSSYVYEVKERYLSDLTYLICLLLPWLCLGLVPGFKLWILRQCHQLKERSNAVRPVRQTVT